MGSESVGSACGRVQGARRLFREEEEEEEEEVTSGNNTPVKEPPRGFQCFACKQDRHVARDRPLLLDSNNKKKSPGPSDRRVYPQRQCPCGRGPCIVLMSRTAKNPGRHFYSCPAMFEEKCGYFLWCDTADCNQQLGFGSPVKLNQQHGFGSPVKLNQQHGLNSPVKQQCGVQSPYQQNGVPESLYPICACGAGKCRLLTMKNGVNAGRRYFACTIKKGQGACNYFQWLDSPVKQSEKEIYIGENKLVPEKQMTLAMNNGMGYHHLGENILPSFLLVNEPRGLRAHDGGAATNKDKPELVLIDVLCVPETPPASPKRVHESSEAGLCSPIKRLSLHDGSPGASRPGKCYRCGGEGHWMKQCIQPLRSPCFRCGRFDHWMRDCTA